ncbi:hypothetical protein TL16_g04087 [Triparma laevis f. inornata]|uniref:Kinesin light chain n=1 Tax=Triparma laevis f. inornata TaxID=1714386 RepID=A0A9W7E3N3_9STRA|nr:hypothetical protein TL16_g04087 [Triparma laevis f. inornata]
MKKNGEYEEAIKVWERCLAGQTKVLREDHKYTLMSLSNLGIVYKDLKYYEKAMEYYERALKGFERRLGKTHPTILMTLENIAIIYDDGLKDYGKAEEMYQTALEGYEAYLGKDHEASKNCAKNFKINLEGSGNSEMLSQLILSYPGLAFEEVD